MIPFLLLSLCVLAGAGAKVCYELGRGKGEAEERSRILVDLTQLECERGELTLREVYRVVRWGEETPGLEVQP